LKISFLFSFCTKELQSFKDCKRQRKWKSPYKKMEITPHTSNGIMKTFSASLTVCVSDKTFSLFSENTAFSNKVPTFNLQ